MKFSIPMLLLALALGAAATSVQARKTTYYEADGSESVVDTDVLKEPTILHDQRGRAIWVCPTQPVYVAKPSYGPGGIAGNSRRIGLQAARRVAASNVGKKKK